MAWDFMISRHRQDLTKMMATLRRTATRSGQNLVRPTTSRACPRSLSHQSPTKRRGPIQRKIHPEEFRSRGALPDITPG
jgi:hypothetical protein